MISAVIPWAYAYGFSLALWAPAKIVPESVEVDAYIAHRVIARCENRSDLPATVSFAYGESYTGAALRMWSGGRVLFDSAVRVEDTVMLAPFDGVVDFDGPSGITIDRTFLVSRSATVTDTDAVALLASGRGTVERVSTFAIAGLGSGTWGGEILNGARLRIRYRQP